MKTENNKFIISNIVCHGDSFKEKIDEINAHLEQICSEKMMAIIPQSNLNPKRYLRKCRLHLNDVGVSMLVRIFKVSLTNFDWQEYEYDDQPFKNQFF